MKAERTLSGIQGGSTGVPLFFHPQQRSLKEEPQKRQKPIKTRAVELKAFRNEGFSHYTSKKITTSQSTDREQLKHGMGSERRK